MPSMKPVPMPEVNLQRPQPGLKLCKGWAVGSLTWPRCLQCWTGRGPRQTQSPTPIWNIRIRLRLRAQSTQIGRSEACKFIQARSKGWAFRWRDHWFASWDFRFRSHHLQGFTAWYSHPPASRDAGRRLAPLYSSPGLSLQRGPHSVPRCCVWGCPGLRKWFHCSCNVLGNTAMFGSVAEAKSAGLGVCIVLSKTRGSLLARTLMYFSWSYVREGYSGFAPAIRCSCRTTAWAAVVGSTHTASAGLQAELQYQAGQGAFAEGYPAGEGFSWMPCSGSWWCAL